MKQVRRIIVSLRLEIMPGREQLIGVFRFIKSRGLNWNPIILTHDQFAAKLTEWGRVAADGVIISEVAPEPINTILSAQTLPVVKIDSPNDFIPTRKNLTTINLDNQAIGRMGAEHFFGMGQFNQFAFVPSKESRHWSRERTQAFVSCVREHGHACSVFDHRRGSLEDWLRNLAMPTAVMVSCDREMIGVLEACRTAGLAIPEQVALLGVDNEEMYCNFTSPSLSSIDPGLEAEGFCAAQELDRLLRDGKVKPHKFINLRPSRVVERESTSLILPAARMIQKAQVFINSTACKGIKVADVVRGMHVSRRLAELRFRQLLGRSIQSCILESRLAQARRMLERTKNPIQEIVMSCGFSSRRQLERLFKARFDASPGSFRSRAQRESSQTG